MFVKNFPLFLMTAVPVDCMMETFSIFEGANAEIWNQSLVFFLWTFLMAVITFRQYTVRGLPAMYVELLCLNPSWELAILTSFS
jgi:hypothetical protein